ncbi:MAG: S41 family peptidase, partial [Fidelibacterota bacterium]
MPRILVLLLLISSFKIFAEGTSNDANIEVIDKAFQILKENYVDDVNDSEILSSSIRGMLKPLDPYTVLLEGDRKEALEMVTRGKYGGVGIQISTRRDTLIVTG